MNFKIERLLVKLGFQSIKPIQFLIVCSASSVVVVLLLRIATNSIAISLSIYLCILAQVIDLIRSRLAKLEQQQNLDWPKYLDAISSAVWSGTSLQQAILDCRNFAPKNAAWAIKELEKDINGGLDLDSALLNFKTRLAQPIADRLVELTRLANYAGGRGYLSALRAQSIQLRSENATWQEIQAKHSWIVSSARLAVFAPWLVLLLLTLRKETADVFSTAAGFSVLMLGLVATLLAFALVRHLAKLPQRIRVLS